MQNPSSPVQVIGSGALSEMQLKRLTATERRSFDEPQQKARPAYGPFHETRHVAGFQNAHERDMTADRRGLDRLSQRSRSTDLDDTTAAASAAQCPAAEGSVPPGWLAGLAQPRSDRDRIRQQIQSIGLGASERCSYVDASRKQHIPRRGSRCRSGPPWRRWRAPNVALSLWRDPNDLKRIR